MRFCIGRTRYVSTFHRGVCQGLLRPGGCIGGPIVHTIKDKGCSQSTIYNACEEVTRYLGL